MTIRSRVGFLLMSAILPLAVAAARPAEASMIGDADVPFHADRTVLFKGHSYSGQVWAIPGRQRHEQTINGFRLVVILRADTATATAMLPDLNLCASFPMSQDLDLESLGEPVSHETVAGLPASKYRLEHEEGDGTGADGWVWVGPHHLLLKVDGDYHTAAGKTVPITATLSHIERGPQDPSLFEIPSTMTALPIEAIGPLLGFK